MQFVFLLKNSKQYTNTYYGDYSASRETETKSTLGKWPRTKREQKENWKDITVQALNLKCSAVKEPIVEKKRKNCTRHRVEKC